MTYELKSNNPFVEWFNKYTTTIPIYAILSGSDIALLEFLTSEFGGFEFFKAPFSDITKKRIFWGSIFNVFIEDIPQLIVQ
ncbi:16855_t:CDS:1, partial [Racocetra persica]